MNHTRTSLVYEAEGHAFVPMRIAPPHACYLLRMLGAQRLLDRSACRLMGAACVSTPMLPSAFVPLYQPRAFAGNEHGRPIHAYADSSPGLSLPLVWDRCPLFCYCQLILDGPSLVLPTGITLSCWGGPVPRIANRFPVRPTSLSWRRTMGTLHDRN